MRARADRDQPDARVVSWLSQRPAATLYLSVLTLGELRKGIDTLADRNRRGLLQDWLEVGLPAFFTGRILPVDAAVADTWGRLLASAGRSLPSIDGLIGATAARHGMSMVTRNAKNYAGLGIAVINPWDA
ncbi:type II toxin-antitoxin system VapC family toxin [Noviherbaspirillum suwonense]|uniref:type II toxin-antitoxin system VapC family toxin n=1 Tax=Noviherbaspirillum suwonense TaxID=1224511 RepID=UPI0024B63F32|nr:type II toxin-antitoxin system VapC family toxin [Noviherbaspirillum suwonense]